MLRTKNSASNVNSCQEYRHMRRISWQIFQKQINITSLQPKGRQAINIQSWRAWWARRKRRVEVARRTARQRRRDLGLRRTRISQLKTSSRRPGRRSVVATAVVAAAMAAGLGLAQKQITLNFSVLITCEPRSF